MWQTGFLAELGEGPPLVVRPGAGGENPTDFPARVRERRGWIQERLGRHGALLFRGFLRGETAELEDFTSAAGLRRMPYVRGNAARRALGQRVYTSTEVSPSLPIPLHCEMSYARRYPLQLAFLCAVAPVSGGETPLADMAAVREAVPVEVRRRFEERGVTYLQWVSGRRLLPWRNTWRQMFETHDRAVVERVCEDQEIEARWRGERLELRSTRPATLVNAAGRRVWFNHAHIYHASFAWELRRAGRRALAAAVGAAERALRGRLERLVYRRAVRYGDGSPIPPADVIAVRAALWDQARSFRWRAGDVLLLDNLRLAHARMPYRGPRRIVAALIDEVATA